MILINELFDAIHSPMVFSEIKNLYFQPRLIRIIEHNKLNCRHYLSSLSYEVFLCAYDDLEMLIKLGEDCIPYSGGEQASLRDEVLSLSYCHFQAVKLLIENHRDKLFSYTFKSNLTVAQFYAMLGLIEIVQAFKAISQSNFFPENSESSCALVIDAVSSILAAHEIYSHIYRELYHEVTVQTVDSLSVVIAKNKKARKSGGEKTMYDGLQSLCTAKADAIWRFEEQNGHEITKKQSLIKKLCDEFRDKWPTTSTGNPNPPKGETLWGWIKDSGIRIPKDARR